MAEIAPKIQRSADWRALNRQIRAGCAQLGLDEAGRRELIERTVGKRSLGDCSDAEMAQVRDAVNKANPAPGIRRDRRRGPQRGGTRPLAKAPQAAKARALWLALYHLGAVRDPAERALDAFVRRQTGIESLAWVGPDEANRAIEALKDWCARTGFDPANRVPEMLPEPGTPQSAGAHGLKARLAAALWLRLHPDEDPAFRDLAKFVGTLHGRELRSLAGARLGELDRAIEALGAALRKGANR